jgi:GNAT superfamily N-acetyltransferase
VLQQEFPLSEYHNRIVVTSAVAAADVLAAAEKVLGAAGLRHRLVSIDDALGEGLIGDFVAAGYEHGEVATMVCSRAEVEVAIHPVQVVSLDQLRPVIMCDWQAEIPDATHELLRQLAERTVLCARGADLTLLAVFEGSEIAAHAELYVDSVNRVAQFESLSTRRDLRGRGYGSALICDALRRSRLAGCELFFLTADVGGQPYQWYERLGYVDVGRTHNFSHRG